VSDEAQLQFICSIVNMAHVLRLKVVAEGVETEEQLKRLVKCELLPPAWTVIEKPIVE
jgi:EAL domain-containing protein (putative c-di-GMP-specific phosphodiesterase class I)